MLSATAGNWPGWRGPEGTGVSSDKNLPLKWSDKENVRWRVALPGPSEREPVKGSPARTMILLRLVYAGRESGAE